MKNVQKRSTADNKQFAAAIKEHAKKHGLTLEEMAKQCDISFVYLMAILRGDRSAADMSLKGYRGVASALGISCFSTMLLAGHLTPDDLITQERDLVSSRNAGRNPSPEA